MTLPRAGTWAARVIDGEYGIDDKGNRVARINVEITAPGPDIGMRMRFEGRFDAKSAPYVRGDIVACGWKCKDIEDLKADVAAWVLATGGATTVEIAHIARKDGSGNFATIRGIGRGGAPLRTPSKADTDDVNKLLRGVAPSDDDSLPF